MAFSFGNPSGGGGGGGGGLFGGSNNNSDKPAQGNLFGSSSTTGGGFSFGGFGNPATTSAANGQSTTTTTGATENKPTFAGFGTPDRSTTSSPATTSAAPLFGSTTPATTKAFSFGTSTTPAGPPPTTAAFGASTGGSSNNLFAPKPAASGGGFSFGKPAESSGQSAGFSFGPPTGGAASKPTEPIQPSPGLFGGGGAPLFKAPDTSSSTTPSNTMTSAPEQKPLFSFPAATPATTSAPETSQPGPAAFGQNIFSKPATTEAAKSPFGLPQAATPQSQSAPAQKPFFSGMGGSVAQQPPTTSGASTGPFSFPTNQSATTAAAAPGAASALPASSQPATSSAPTLGGFSFGKPAATPAAQPATSSAPETAPASSLGGFSFGKPASTTAAQPAATSTAASAPTLGGFSFGKPASTAAPQPAATATAPASTPFSGFGATATTASSQPTTNATAPPTGATSFPASTTGPAPPAQSRLRNKTMDEILTRWATDMSRYAKDFKDHAETIAHWDQLIVDNSSKIDKLYVRTRTAERQTVSIDMQLSAVENSQAELESWLTKYENDVDEMLAKESATPSELGGPDQERERTYKLAEKLGERLDDMEKDLGSMVEEVNAANASLSRNVKGDEPITQIVKILNSHLVQLQAIDQGTQVLQEKVASAQKAASQLGYLNGSSLSGSSGPAAVQDFLRSYQGHRRS